LPSTVLVRLATGSTQAIKTTQTAANKKAPSDESQARFREAEPDALPRPFRANPMKHANKTTNFAHLPQWVLASTTLLARTETLSAK